MDLQSAEALLARARQRGVTGDVEGARADLDRAVELEPRAARVRLLRAMVLISQREHAAAKDDVERAVELGGGAPALAVRGWLALHLDGDPPAAERDLSAAIDGGDRQSSTYVTRGWARNALGDHAGALADARRAVANTPLDADARFLAAVSRVHLGDAGGAGDLDRAEALFAVAGDQRGRREVWDVRTAIRQGRTSLPAGPAPWLWFGPRPERDGSRGVLVIRGSHLSLVAAVRAIRFLVTVGVVAVLTAVLPGAAAGPPVVVTLLALSLAYRLLHTGVGALLASLLFAVPGGLLHWLQAGSPPVVGMARWLGSGLVSAGLFAVATGVVGWFGLEYRFGGAGTVIVVGAVLGLGTFVSFPVLRRASN